MRSNITTKKNGFVLNLALIIAVSAILVACGGGGSGGDSNPIVFDPAQATADPRSQKLLVNWEAESGTTYNLFWSTDPELEPENYASFADSGMAADIQPPYSLEGLENNRNYYLYLESENGSSAFSERFGTRPMGGGVSGLIRAMAKDSEGNLYLGGNFPSVGYNAGGLIAFDRSTELPIHSPFVAGIVTAIEPDVSGGFYVAGLFEYADGEEVNNIVRLNPDLSLDTSWQVETDNLVYAIAVEDDRILIGGSFSKVNNFDRYGLAALSHEGDVLTFTADLGVAPDHDGAVLDIAITDDHIIVGGSFSDIAGESRENLAALSPNGTVDLSWQADTDDLVRGIFRHNDRLYIAGNFQNVGGSSRVAAAALSLDGETLNFDAEITSGEALSIAVINGAVYIGGLFEGPSDNLLATDTSGNSIALAAGEVEGLVSLVQELDGNILISGTFQAIGGVTRSGLALLNDQGELLEDLQTGTQAAFAIHSSEDTLLIGSIATPNYRTVPRGGLAKLTKDGDIAEWQTGVNEQVFALAYHNDTLYAGGQFTETLGGVARNRLAAFDPTNGALKTDWTPQANGGLVRGIVGRSGELHIVGEFNDVNGNPSAGLATLTASGQFVVRMPEVTGGVQSVARDGVNLYIAGSFTHVDGTPRYRVAAVNSATGALLPWNPDLSQDLGMGSVILNTIDVFSGRVYIGGRFDEADGETRINAAAYNTEGNVLDWNPDPNDEVFTLLANVSGVRIGGDFDQLGGEDATNFALVDNDGDLLAAAVGIAPPFVDSMIEIDGGFCIGSNGNFILGKQMWASIACLDDDLNGLW